MAKKSIQEKRDAVSAATHIKQLDRFKDETDEITAPEPRLNWMNQSKAWGTRIEPDDHGMRLNALNVGIYGEVPSTWPDRGRNPRGAIPVRGTPPLKVGVDQKTDLWAESAGELYEEAIQRRWIPATDIPWETITPLPNDIERAICQVCTELGQFANTEIEVITSWQFQMAYGFHEVKQYLATASFDAARRYEALRKRMLINGGGIGYEAPCQMNRFLRENVAWTETVTGLVFHRLLFALTIYEYLCRVAFNNAERTIYRYVIQDLSRLTYYGIEHLKYALATDESKTAAVSIAIGIGDRMFNRDLRDPSLREACAIIFGGGLVGARREGMRTWFDMLDDYATAYLALCKYLNIPRTLEQLPKPLDKNRRFESSKR